RADDHYTAARRLARNADRVKQRRCVLGTQRRADVEALGELAAEELEVVELRRRLDALGEHLEAEVVREADERLDDLERARLDAHPDNQRAVDLHRVAREAV